MVCLCIFEKLYALGIQSMAYTIEVVAIRVREISLIVKIKIEKFSSASLLSVNRHELFFFQSQS